MPENSSRSAEREARRAGVDVLPDGPEQEPEHDHRQRLERRAAGQRDRGDEARAPPARRTRPSRSRARCVPAAGANRTRTRVPTVPAKNEPMAAVASAAPARPATGHLVAVDRRHRRRGLARQVDEDRGRGAAVLGAVVDAREHDQRGDRLERERDRQEHRDGRGRARFRAGRRPACRAGPRRNRRRGSPGVSAVAKPRPRLARRSIVGYLRPGSRDR